MLHTGIVAWMLHLPPAITIPQQQIIEITLVAVSSQNSATARLQQEEKIDRVIEQPQPKISKLREMAIKTEKSKQAHQQAQEKSYTKNSSAMLTSGQQVKNAIEKLSANTKPIYDAISLHNTPPAYPISARCKGVEGEVLLAVSVTKEGNAKEVLVSRSSGYAILDKAARDSISNWHFIPARSGNEIVEAQIEIPVKFQLD